MKEYSFKVGSTVDRNLTDAWMKEDPCTWLTFLVNLPNVLNAEFTSRNIITLSFDSESAISLFLLRWR